MLRTPALVLSTILGLAGAVLSVSGAQAELGHNDGMNPPIFQPGQREPPPPRRVDPGRPRDDHGYRGHGWGAPAPHYAPPAPHYVPRPRVVPHYDHGTVYIQPRRPPPRRIAPRYGYYPPYAAPGWERPRFHVPGWYQ